MNSSQVRSGGKLVADQLRLHGAKTIFGVPGESFLPVLDGLYDYRDTMPFIACRQEGGAAMMAEAYGKLTGTPGICMVTRGPGATNASAGIHIAHQDSTPMIVFVGQVGREFIERDAFQEIDYRRMFGQFTKWVAEIDDVRRIPEFIGRAFHLAVSGRPGPVVLALPDDMLKETAAVPDSNPYQHVEAAPSPEALSRLYAMLSRAERPLAIVGGGGWDTEASARLRQFVDTCGLPVAAAFRRQDYLPNDHPCYVGDVGIGVNPALAAAVRDTDLLLVAGARLGEMTTSGYKLVDIPKPKQPMIHVHGGASELGRLYQADLLINSGPRAFANALSSLPGIDGSAWKAWREDLRQSYEEWQRPVKGPGNVQVSEIVALLSANLPRDAIIANGAGNYTAWVHRFFRYKDFGTQLAATSGSMGYGVPAAVAAKIMNPGRTVVAFSGDGCFLMTGQEFATAVQYRAPIIVVLINNGMYGTIRMHQEMYYPGRVSGTDLINPDFAAYARAFGGFGAVVTKTADFLPAFEEAQASGLPSILDVRVDPEAITPRQTLSQIKTGAKERED